MLTPFPAVPFLTTPAWCMACAQAPAVALVIVGHVALAIGLTATGDEHCVPGPWLPLDPGGYLCAVCLLRRQGDPILAVYPCPIAPAGAR